MLGITINIKKISSAFALFKRAYSGYVGQIVITTLLGFLSGIASGIGIGMLIPVFYLVSGQQNLIDNSKLSGIISKTFSILHLGYNLPLILSLMVVLFAIKATVSLVTTYLTEKISGQYLEKMRGLSLRETLSSNWSYLMNQKIGYLDKIISDDSTYGAGILKNISETALRFTSLAAYTFIALNISVTITLISLGGGALIFFFLKPYFFKIRKLSGFLSQASKETSHHLNESLIGIKTIKAFAVEKPVVEKSYIQFEELRKAQIKSAYLSNLQGILFEPAALIFIALIFLFSYKTPDFSIVSFIVIIYLIQKIFSFIQAIQSKLNLINSALPYLHNMLQYQDETAHHQEIYSGKKQFKFNDTLNVKNLTFAYPTSDNILSGVSFLIKKGEMTGIIGPSGSGKTTLVDILLRLLKPQSGTVTSDDIDIDSIGLDEWRKNVGYVSQDVFLLNDTIEANIRFYNKSVSRSDVITASKTANIHNFIQELPDKLETIVGERGVKLSGGQKQRIALARALARKPSILILDEATSALDNESEALIQESINGLRGKISVIVIAHRLSTVMSSDSIIVLERGKIVESGSPQELLKDKGSYLYKSYHIAENR